MGPTATFIYPVEKHYCGRNGHLAVYSRRNGLKNKNDLQEIIFQHRPRKTFQLNPYKSYNQKCESMSDANL